MASNGERHEKRKEHFKIEKRRGKNAEKAERKQENNS